MHVNSKERVLTTFEHREPDRVPLWYGASEVLTAKLIKEYGVSDEEELMGRLHIDWKISRRYMMKRLNVGYIRVISAFSNKFIGIV